MTYNPNTYDWYQCDEEDYDSGTPPDEQTATAPLSAEECYDATVAEARAADESDECAAALREAWGALQAVPAYCERYQCDMAHEESETDILRERMAQDNPALASAADVRLADLYDNL